LGIKILGFWCQLKPTYSANLKPLMFKPMMQELLNIKQFHERKFKKIKTMFLREIGARCWYYKKALISGILWVWFHNLYT
jgi:hypothetical protein